MKNSLNLVNAVCSSVQHFVWALCTLACYSVSCSPVVTENMSLSLNINWSTRVVIFFCCLLLSLQTNKWYNIIQIIRNTAANPRLITKTLQLLLLWFGNNIWLAWLNWTFSVFERTRCPVRTICLPRRILAIAISMHLQNLKLVEIESKTDIFKSHWPNGENL